jgi:hypothetical protein
MTDLVEPLVQAFTCAHQDAMGQVVVQVGDEWSLVFMRPYGDELVAQARAENEIADLDYVVLFARGAEQEFWLYNCIESIGIGADDDGDPFLVITFDDELADEGIFVRPEFFANFERPGDTWMLADQILNIIDADATAPLSPLVGDVEMVDADVHPAVAHARRRRFGAEEMPETLTVTE